MICFEEQYSSFRWIVRTKKGALKIRISIGVVSSLWGYRYRPGYLRRLGNSIPSSLAFANTHVGGSLFYAALSLGKHIRDFRLCI